MRVQQHVLRLTPQEILVLKHAFQCYKLVLTSASDLLDEGVKPYAEVGQLAHVAGLLPEHERDACTCPSPNIGKDV